MRLLDLSGYMFSGKAALHDFLSEVEGIWSPGNRLEFDLLRVKDGVADLDAAIFHWSPIRSDAAVRRFVDLVHKMSANNTFVNRVLFPGFDYGHRFPNLLNALDRFIARITADAWDMYWPYHLLDMSAFSIAVFKIRRKLFGETNNLHYRLIDKTVFRDALKDFLEEVLFYRIDSTKFHTVITNNAFEPFEPEMFLDYFRDAKCIVVNRDPRDIFVAANQFSEGFNDQTEMYRRIAGAFDVETFIRRIKIYRSSENDLNSGNLLRIDFEALVQEYDDTRRMILDFLGLDISAHRNPLSRFNPQDSQKNIGIWMNYHDQVSIRKIEDALL
jgi:hypothetical protein